MQHDGPRISRNYEDFAQAIEAAKDIKFAMAVTEAGALHARPLTTQAADPDGTLWFFVSATSDLASELASRPDMLLLYADTDSSRYLSIAGRGALVRDTQKAKQLWSRMVEVYFPGGVDDADLRLLRVDVASIELWEPNGTRVGQFLRMAAAAMGAGTKATDTGRHEVLTGGVHGSSST